MSFHQVAAHCSIFLRRRVMSVVGVYLEGQGCDDLRPATSGDFSFL